MAWTVPPGALNYSPAMMSHYFQFLPQSNELMAGPGGVGYATAMTGSDLSTFGTLTNDFMTAEGMSSVTSWQTSSSMVPTFATDANVPHVVWRNAYSYTLNGNTVIDGQVISYNATPAAQISAIESYVSSNWSSSAPLFVEALSDGWALSPDDVLYIAQQLQKNGGHTYVFMTPSEMALTEKAYHSGTTGLPASNTQAVPGSTIVSAFPNNLLLNGNGQNGPISITGSWTIGSTGNHETLVGIKYQGVGTQRLTVPANAANTAYAWTPVTLPLQNVYTYYHFAVNVAGTGTVRLCVYDGSANNYSSAITLTPSFQTIDMMVLMKSTTTGQLQVQLPVQSSAATVYFQNITNNPDSWYYSAGAAGALSLTQATYNYTPAWKFTIPANEGADELVADYPSLVSGNQYTFSVDVAGSGQVYLDADTGGGSGGGGTSVVTLGTGYQTLSINGTIGSSSAPQLQVRAHTQSSPVTVYFRNASVTPVSGTTDFSTGLESGQTALTWTNTIDNTSPGGGESNVSSAVAQLSTSAMSHGGSNAIQYGGTASGGSTNYAYLEAFSNSTTLSSTSRLSYWVFPQSPLGSEPGASSTTGQNSTCVAIDIIFTNGTSLRSKTAITDQYGNQMHPADMCNHLIPDQWNYVTTNLGSLSGLTISRIDVGYDQPNAPAGNYAGYIDDISLTH